jgi:hypothetical protein
MRSKHGASYRLLDQLEDHRWRPNVTVAIVLEYEAVLKRNCEDFGFTEEVIDDVVDPICSQADCIASIFAGDLWPPIQTTTRYWRGQLQAAAISSLPSINVTFRTARGSEFAV